MGYFTEKRGRYVIVDFFVIQQCVQKRWYIFVDDSSMSLPTVTELLSRNPYSSALFGEAGSLQFGGLSFSDG